MNDDGNHEPIRSDIRTETHGVDCELFSSYELKLI